MSTMTPHHAIESAARRSAFRAVKDRAASYIAFPSYLDNLAPGFAASAFTFDQLIEFGRELLRRETSDRRLSLVPVRKINARGAMIAARYARAKASQIARRAA